VLILLIGGSVMLIYARGRGKATVTPGTTVLSEAEQAELAKVLEDRDRLS
jgi:cytochrome c-type biogenesis protein CcmH